MITVRRWTGLMRCKALLCLLIILSMLCGCGAEVLSTDGMEIAAAPQNGYVNDTDTVAPGAYAATDKEEAALATMRKVLSNEYAELYIGEYYDIAVRNLKTGGVWFSNEAIYDEEVRKTLTDVGKEQTFSQLALEYFDNAGKRFELTSYPDSYTDENQNNVTLQTAEDAVTVIYDFGEKDLTETICFAFTAESFEALESIAQQKIAEKALTRNEYARFTRSYKHAVLENLSDSERAVILNAYPQLKEWGELYLLLNPTTSVKKIVTKVSGILGIDKTYIDAEMKKIGIEKASMNRDAYFFEIPVTYRLDGADLLAQIDTANIIDKDGFYLTQIHLLGTFGAAHQAEDGYTFIPDGSGVVIENTMTTTGQSYLDIPFYGSDFCINNFSGNMISAYAPFPVFGVKAGNKGYLAICEEGSAIGGVTAQIPNGITPYNSASAWLTYRAQDINADKNYVYAPAPQHKFTVRYHFLHGDASTYSGMAQYYQTYLLQTGMLKKKDVSPSLPLQLSFVCAIDKKQQILGMPMDTIVAASTLTDIEAFVEKMNKSAIGNIQYTLQGAINGGMDFMVPREATLEKVIGGEKAYASLLNKVQSIGSVLNLGIDFTRVYKNGNGLKQNQQISRYISRNVAFVSEYEPSSLARETERIAYLLNPQAYAPILSEFMEDNARYGNNNLFVYSAASYLSANYNDKYLVHREQSKSLTVQALKALAEQGYRLTMDGCNDYALIYADALTDIPVTSGGYAIESYAVPFIGMVLHGYMDYSSGPLNNNGNYEKARLQMIESGAGLNYMLITGDTLMLADTKYSDLYNVSSAYWQERIVAEYAQLNKVFAPLSSCTIVDHCRLANRVFRTTYSNGTAIIVNYNDTAVTVEGHTVEGLSWIACA